MRKLIFIILILSFTALYFYSVSSTEKPSGDHFDETLVNQTLSSVKKMFNKSTSASQDTSSSQNANSTAAVHETSLEELNAAQLKQWVSRESMSLNSTNNNTEELQIGLRAQAKTLRLEQLQSLKNIALSISEPVNERIFSAYLLSLSSVEGSQSQLYDVAQAAVPDFGPVLPHSESELRHSQELAIRYMNIDELFERAKTDTNARDKLKLLSERAESTQVRSYAERKLKELK